MPCVLSLLCVCASTQESEFCYSPRGGSGGDTDRYMAALMFGCIPVMLSSGIHNEPMYFPFDEVIPWQVQCIISKYGILDSLSVA